MNKLAVIFSVCFANLGLNSTAYAAPSIPQELLENSLVYCTTSSDSLLTTKIDVIRI
ncbi:Uncharacterised protein [Mannheimia haemolytica]|uniref:Uncharacterized protein n=1 Tax=Mannheimia haemolytica TaxID=75985 RepID=A0A378N665_MANHA|nr:Uncharacterised protein [Mannheimia haemolytica]